MNRGRPTFTKRQKEMARQQKQKEKTERRAKRKADRESRPEDATGGEDPDIAGIIPGPQAPPDLDNTIRPSNDRPSNEDG